MNTTDDLRSIKIDSFLPHAPDKVWRALTEPDLMARWLMVPTDFKLAVGQQFTFQGIPVPRVNFDGIAHCEVLAFEAERMLCIRWGDREKTLLNSTVTWRLEPESDGTHLFMEHAGFDPESAMQQMSRKIMSGGWLSISQRLTELLDAQE